MSRSFKLDREEAAAPDVPLNREERRKKRWRPEEDIFSKGAQTNERLRDTRSRTTFIRRLGPR